MKHTALTLVLFLLSAATSLAGSLVPNLLPRPYQAVARSGYYRGDVAAARVVMVSDAELGTFDYPLAGFPNEGYRLTVAPDAITITAASEVGVIRARQTLEQLRQPDGTVECCDITDRPAFKVRGYMHDVGRSFITFDELLREVDLLARFKVNMFHWHLTDNQGFRFESRLHPELNARGYERFDGCYYTQEQCRRLEAYARERGMVVIPEIDMPGHSRSFEAATGCTMLSPEGRAILKDVLGELAAAFPLAPYIHVGADESGATVAYVRELTDHVHSLGRRAVCWNRYGGAALVTPEPMGIDFTTNWATMGTLIPGIPNVDMRYFYTNHFDIFADVAGAYRSSIFGVTEGSPDVAGVSIGIWNDRLVSDERQIVSQNNLYAAVIAMAERGWMGGGRQYIEQGGAYLPCDGPDHADFSDWERRFLYYKDLWLAAEPIPYVRQSNVRWCITPAYDNAGDPSAVFPPEQTPDLQPTPGSIFAAGAGVWLQHIWSPIVAGVLGQERQSFGQTRYAWTYVYSPVAQTVGAQIQFYDYSRSDHGLTPPDGRWDLMGSRVWLNDRELLPAWRWDNAGRDVTLRDLEVDLGNLNFPARAPLAVHLHRGWNKVLLKLPYVDAHQARGNKWQFTFVLTDLQGRHAVDGLVYSPEKAM